MIGSSGRRAIARPVAIGGVAVLALAAGATAGYAATHHSTNVPAHTAALTNTPSSSNTGSSTPKVRHDHLRWGMGLPGIGLGALGDMLHGQAVLAKPGGGYQTMDVQRGAVTAVSSTSITVKSADGYSASYAVNNSTMVDAHSAGISSVKTGDTVFVAAIVSGHTATAVSVLDVSAIKSGRIAFGFHVPKHLPKNLPALFPAPGAAPNS